MTERDHITNMSARYFVRFAVYSIVIGLAFIVPAPMNVIQAAIGGMALGAKLVMFAIDKEKL